MVAIDISAFFLNYGMIIANLLLVFVTLIMAIATAYLYRATRQQKNITEELGKLQLDYQSNIFNIQKYELELAKVIRPLYYAIQDDINPNAKSLNNFYFSRIIGDKTKDIEFWREINEYLYLCPPNVMKAIYTFLSLRTERITDISEPPEFIAAKENLIREIEARYGEINIKLNNLYSQNPLIIKAQNDDSTEDLGNINFNQDQKGLLDSINSKEAALFYIAASIGLATGIAGNLFISSMFRVFDEPSEINVIIFIISIFVVAYIVWRLNKCLSEILSFSENPAPSEDSL